MSATQFESPMKRTGPDVSRPGPTSTMWDGYTHNRVRVEQESVPHSHADTPELLVLLAGPVGQNPAAQSIYLNRQKHTQNEKKETAQLPAVRPWIVQRLPVVATLIINRGISPCVRLCRRH